MFSVKHTVPLGHRTAQRLFQGLSQQTGFHATRCSVNGRAGSGLSNEGRQIEGWLGAAPPGRSEEGISLFTRIFLAEAAWQTLPVILPDCR